MSQSEVNIAIIGAGPYGLSLSTHLTARRVEHRIFGSPMHAWASMSPGMFLKSFGWATSVHTPQSRYTLPEYCGARGLEMVEPIEIATYARYGIWLQQELVPHIEPTNVTRLTHRDGRFELTLDTGERVLARRVVSAVGLTYFERLPEELMGLPDDVAIHTARESDFARFDGKHVVVIGAGQSALQAAALLHEHGAQVEMFVRGSGVYFGDKMPERRPIKQRLLYPNSALGPGRENWVLQHVPLLLYHLPDEKRLPFTRKHLGPYGAWWLKDRVVGLFPVHPYQRLKAAVMDGNSVNLQFVTREGDEHIVRADHVIAGTGYQPNLDHISFIDPELRAQIARVAEAPRLNRHFEASVPGLYFVGPASALSFGPLFRFVAGSHFSSPHVARHLAHARDTRRDYASVAPAPQKPSETVVAGIGDGAGR